MQKHRHRCCSVQDLLGHQSAWIMCVSDCISRHGNDFPLSACHCKLTTVDAACPIVHVATRLASITCLRSGACGRRWTGQTPALPSHIFREERESLARCARALARLLLCVTPSATRFTRFALPIGIGNPSRRTVLAGACCRTFGELAWRTRCAVGQRGSVFYVTESPFGAWQA